MESLNSSRDGAQFEKKDLLENGSHLVDEKTATTSQDALPGLEVITIGGDIRISAPYMARCLYYHRYEAAN